MKVLWSSDAVEQLQARYGSDVSQFRLVYDTEGCGCAVNGVPALWVVTEPGLGDRKAASEPFVLWHDPRHALYFDETLRIQYRPDTRSFSLSSDGQTYTSRMVLADHRTDSNDPGQPRHVTARRKYYAQTR